MRAFKFGDEMAVGRLGHPRTEAGSAGSLPRHPARAARGFDRSGHRIGYGAGHYDRTIARLRDMKTVTAIGVCFAVQEIERVPATAFDQRLDLVLTENEIVDFR